MPRSLSSREQQVLLAMIEHADEGHESQEPTAADRDGWRSHLPALTVDDVCGCGQCPSVSLTKASGNTPWDDEERVVLAAGVTDALVLLFIDGGVPSYLELAPLDDQTVYTEFPDASMLCFEKPHN